jgi:PAS domain S-box-containing protein
MPTSSITGWLMDFSETKAMLRLLIVALLVVSPGVVAQTVKKPSAIRVVMDNDYAPFVFRSDEGRLQGILVDQWRAWEKKTGIRADIYAMDWDQALRRMRAGEFDVIDCIVATHDRKAFFDFTPGYAAVGASIFFRKDISGITDMASLKGFPVGVKSGDQHVDRLRENGVTTVVPFQSYNEIVKAAKQHRISIFVADEPAALYLLNKTGLDRDFRHSPPIFRDELRRAVRKGDARTLHIVSDGIAAIETGELKQIDERWFGRTINTHEQYLGFARYGAVAALLLISAVFSWNRALSRKILRRTAALGESEQRFREIAEHSREVFWLTTADSSRMLYISPAYETVWGRRRESLYQDPRSFVAAIHPEDRPVVVEAIERNRERGFEVEYRVVRPDGSIRWIWDRGFPIKDHAARVYRVAGIAEDVTDRKLAAVTVKQADDRIRLIIETIPAMVWRIRPDGVIDFINQRGLHYMGLSIEEAFQDSTQTIHPDDLSRAMEKWRLDMAEGVPSEDEMRLRRADGEYRWFLIRTVPQRDERGNIVNWYGTSTDIEDRKRAEDKLKATSEQLRVLSARLQSAREEESIRIAREVHDELGSTLTVLRWELEGVKKTTSEPGKALPNGELKERLASMLELTDTMIGIVRRIASDLRPVALDLLGLEHAIEWHARQFRDRTGIAVHYESAAGGVELGPAQSTAVFRIFQEALTNVLRHARATRVDITVAEEAGVFVLVIGDNGRGITERERNNELSIGLLGMRERAHLIGGEIDVTGIDGEGTTLTLRLPVAAH